MNRHSVQRQRIGPAVRRMRRARGLTLDALADVAAVSPSHLSRLERSQTLPSFPVLAKIADALDVDVNEFVRLEQDVAQMDEELSSYAQMLALETDVQRELLDLSIEARRALVDRLDQLSVTAPTSGDVQDQVVRALESSREDAAFSAVSTLIERSGLDAVTLTRVLRVFALLNGRRSMVIAGPSLLPISPGGDVVGAYQWAFPNFPVEPSVAQWWPGAMQSAATGTHACSVRVVVAAAALTSPLGSVIARSLLESMKRSGSLEVAVTERSLGPVSLLSGGEYALLEQIAPRRRSTDPNHVGLWVTGPDRVKACEEIFERIWGSLTEEERSLDSSRGRLFDVVANSS